MSGHGSRDRRAGVSLFEMLIALALMSMIALMAATALRSAGGLLMRNTAVSAVTEIALARDELRRWIEHAIADPTSADRSYAIAGSARSLRINSILDDGTFWPGIATSVVVKQHEVDRDAVSVTASGLSDRDRSGISRSLALSGDHGRLTIAYFGRRPADPEAGWHSEWSASDGSPDLVRIAITDAGMTYPPLIARPGKAFLQREMSLSSLLPPAFPSRP